MPPQTDRAEPEEAPKDKIYFDIPYSVENEKLSKHFLNKFRKFTNDNYMSIIMWKTRKVKTLFTLKDQNPPHILCVKIVEEEE